jgi:hypothetical protein
MGTRYGKVDESQEFVTGVVDESWEQVTRSHGDLSMEWRGR